MPLLDIDYIPLRESRVVLRGTVKNSAGIGLVRRVLLLDHNRQQVSATTSTSAGNAEFVVNGTERDLFVVLAVGAAGECDAISCPLAGTPER